MTIEQFGQSIKAKYPQYADVPDAELGQKMLEKYPDYQSVVTQPTQTQAAPTPEAPAKQGFLKGLVKDIANPFLRLGATANALGTSKLLGGKGANLQPAQTPLGEVKPITTAKDAAGVGLELGGNALLGSGGSILGNIVKSAFAGAALNAGSGIQKGQKGKQLAINTAVGAGLGAATAGIGGVLGKAKQAVTEKLPESLMNHAVKPTLNELKRNIKQGTDTLGAELLQEGVKGSPTGLLKISESKLNQYEGELQSLLSNSEGKITRDSLKKYVQPAIEKLKKTPGVGDKAKIFEQALNEVPEKMSVVEANEIKRNIYSELRDVAYKLDPNLSKPKEAMKSIAAGLKREIEGQFPTVKGVNPITEINKKLSIYGRLEDRVVEQLAKSSRNQLINYSDAVLSSIGISHPLAFAALVAKKGAGSTRVLTNAAVGLNKLSGVGTGAAAKTGKILIKRPIVGLPASLNTGQ